MVKNDHEVRILGDRVRYFRKLRGLSQSKLADGICTQATISLVEKRNKVPSMKILVQIVRRLGVQMTDVVVEPQDQIQITLDQAVAAMRHRQPDTAAAALATLDEEHDLHTVDDQKRFYYVQGMIQLTGERKPEEAVYYFNRVLQLFTGEDADVYAVMAILGLALAYADMDNLGRTRLYVNEALTLLQDVHRQGEAFLDSDLLIRWYICSALYRLGDYQEVLHRADAAIELAVHNERLFLLDEFYALRARCLVQLRAEGTNEAFTVAISWRGSIRIMLWPRPCKQKWPAKAKVAMLFFTKCY